ncbi:MAG TPA: DUF92 domain-containing protein [Thermoanaerobaculia bacterium]|nr:DUF92 domain-containing protein [Thermoanaerobaculia bacterium]
MPHEPNELLRKSLHIAVGLFAITLRWLPWWAAAAAAAAAVLGNWLVLHRLVGTRVSRHERGWDAGIVLYPAAVLVLIVVFRDDLAIAAIAWVILAIGDGFATIAGKTAGGPTLPWNRQKRWSGLLAFIIAGAAGGIAIGWWMGYDGHAAEILVAVVCAAIVESLALGLDDNVTVPAAAALTLLFFSHGGFLALVLPAGIWMVVNTLLAVAGFLTRSVDLSGAAGGWVLGSILILCTGWPMYVALLAFFVIGTAATKLGYRRKAAAGLAQEREGRRGFSHAFSNAGVAAICALFFARWAGTDHGLTIYLMGIASLATAAADTTASEIGQLAGRRTFLPLTFRPVPPGTEGAISIEGTIAGVAAGAVVAIAGTLSLERMLGIDVPAAAAALIALAAFLGSYIESIVGSWNRTRSDRMPNGVLNFFNTAVGAMLFYWMSRVDWLIAL